MATSAQIKAELPAASVSGLPATLPVMVNAKDVLMPPGGVAGVPGTLRFIDAQAITPTTAVPAAAKSRKREKQGEAVLRGIKDLQQLQKQTIAVLESVKGSLDEIQQVLRSPEATRGMEKLQNAAALLTKGFATEAVEQAQGAVGLLPANPDAHLLLSLSLAAHGEFETSLAMARKGLALIDRRQHPLAIECGLLHALAALGCASEAVERWGAIVDVLPLPVLFEQMARIGACFPSEGLGGGAAVLDDLINRRLARDDQKIAAEPGMRRAGRLRANADGVIETRADDIPAGAVFAALDAAKDYQLACTHRAILAQIARRQQLVKDAGDVVKFLGECVVPLANRGLDRSATALGRASVKRLMTFHADVMTLHRAMGKLELAGTRAPLQEVASLLNHWRKAGARVARARKLLALSMAMVAGGLGVLAYVLWGFRGGAMAGHSTLLMVLGRQVDALWFGPGMMMAGGLVGLKALFGRTWHVALPGGRPGLTAEERAYLRTASLRGAIRSALAVR